MPLPVPKLDDESYDDLVTEARSLLPRHLPAWTDHNPSDPGITLLELFAFLAEAAIWQLDRIPERTLRRFAALVGVPANADEPADALLSRAIQAVAATRRAVTPADVERVVTNGVFSVQPALEHPIAAGTAMTGLERVALIGGLARPAAAGEVTVLLARTATVRPDDLLLFDDETADPTTGAAVHRTEFAQVRSVQPGEADTDPTEMTLIAALRFPHPAKLIPYRVVHPAAPVRTTVAVPVPAHADVIAVEPSPELRRGGVLRLDDGDTAVCLRARAVARARVHTRTAVATRPGTGTQAAVGTRTAEEPTVSRTDPTVSVLVVPDQPGIAEPTPSEALTQAAFALLRARSPVTTRIRVVGPRYQPVGRLDIAATVVRDFTSLLRKDTVQRTAEDAVRAFLGPLTGGDTGAGWEFGRPIYRSELYHLLERTPGVDHVRRLLLVGDAARSHLDLAIDPDIARQSLVGKVEVAVTVVDP